MNDVGRKNGLDYVSIDDVCIDQLPGSYFCSFNVPAKVILSARPFTGLQNLCENTG